MRNGIIFIWSEKEILGKLMKIMEEKGFVYIENFVIALLNPAKVNDDSQSSSSKKNGKSKTKNSPAKSQTNKNKRVNLQSDVSDSNSTTESPKEGTLNEEENADYDDFLLNLDKYSTIEADQLLYEGKSDFLRSSKRVLMMFRRVNKLSFDSRLNFKYSKNQRKALLS